MAKSKEEKPTAYEEFTGALAGLKKIENLYEQISAGPHARKLAAHYLAQQGEEAIAEEIVNPSTPIDKVSEALNIFGVRAVQHTLEEIVTNKFENILDSAPEGLLENLLDRIKPYAAKEDYKDFVKEHTIYQTLRREDKAKERINEIKKYYDETYKANEKDSNFEKEQKILIKQFCLSMYIKEGKENKALVQRKYQEINEEALQSFVKKVRNKKFVADYIVSLLPKEVEARTAFLQQLIAEQQRAQEESE